MSDINRKPEVGKWTILFRFDRIMYLQSFGWRQLDIGVFKLKSKPPEGAFYSGHHYQGFWFRFRFWLPFEFESMK